MTSRERMVAAFLNRQPDMVPVSPDMSNMIPARLTGKPFWGIYLYDDPPLASAYVEAVKHYGFDGWSDKGELTIIPRGEWVSTTDRILEQTHERIVVERIHHTPAGDLDEVIAFPRDVPPTKLRKLVKNLPEDLPKLAYLYPAEFETDDRPLREHMAALGELGAVGGTVCLPGMPTFCDLFEGSLQGATFAYCDHPDEFAALVRMVHEHAIAYARAMLAARPDFLLLGASGLLTLQSPRMVRQVSLPTIKELTRMAKDAGIPSHLHACGKEAWLVELCATETDLSSIEPLEEPPMGDCDLAEIKWRWGRRIALKGNLHTTRVMAHGTSDDVERAARKALDAAAEGGGFVLSTGDQCGGDTPDANIFRLVEVARRYGRY
jgi:uroporphyrinogen decarboxylase